MDTATREIFAKHYVKETKKFLACITFYDTTGIKVSIAIKRDTRALTYKFGDRRWRTKRGGSLRPDLDPTSALLWVKQAFLARKEPKTNPLT